MNLELSPSVKRRLFTIMCALLWSLSVTLIDISAQEIDPTNKNFVMHLHPTSEIVGITDGVVFETYTLDFSFVDDLTLLTDPSIVPGNFDFQWNPDGSKLAFLLSGIPIAPTSEVLQIWSTTPTQKLLEIPGVNVLTGIAWRPDGTRFAVRVTLTSDDEVIRVYDSTTGQILTEIESSQISQLAWSAEDDLLLSEGATAIKVWNANTGDLVREIDVIIDPEVELAVSPSDNLVAFVNLEEDPNVVEIWDIDSGRFVRQLEGHTGFVTDIQWDEGGLVTTGIDDSIRIWNAQSGYQLRSFSMNRYPRAEISSSGDFLLVRDRVVPVQGRDATFGDIISILGTSTTPVADASLNQTVNDTDNNGSQLVTLNGSGSSDSDGTIVTYSWKENGVEIATGVSPQFNFLVGTHTIRLTVTDDDGGASSDEVVVKVNALPVANANSVYDHVEDWNNDGIEGAYISATGSVDNDGTIVSYVWKEHGNQIATGSAGQFINLSLGQHIITLTVTDNDGATDDDEVTINVVPVPYVILQCGSEVCLADPYNTFVMDGGAPSIGSGNRVATAYKLFGSGIIITDTDDLSTIGSISGTSATTYTEPSISPDGLKVAYAYQATSTSKYVIRTASIDGTNVQTLTATTRNSRRPQWSPDGTQIVFYADNGGDNEIYVMNANGSNISALTNNSFNDIDPDWSSDNRIVFSSNRDSNQEIYRMSADGSSVVRLTTNPVTDVEPAWSPDGASVAFASNRLSVNSTTAGTPYRIFMMNSSDGSQVTQVSWPGLFETHRYPSWGFINPPLPGCEPGTCLVSPEDPPEE